MNDVFDGWLNSGVIAHSKIAVEGWLENVFFDKTLDGAYHAGVENFQLRNHISTVKPFGPVFDVHFRILEYQVFTEVEGAHVQRRDLGSVVVDGHCSARSD